VNTLKQQVCELTAKRGCCMQPALAMFRLASVFTPNPSFAT